MTNYYSGLSWFDANYKIRTPVTLEPFAFLPGSESLCAVKFNKQALLNKTKPDFSDMIVVYSVSGSNVGRIPFYVLDEGSENICIVFESQFQVTELSDSNYSIYYSAKTESRQVDAADLLDPANLTLTDNAQQLQTHWAFTKPAVEWVDNYSQVSGAKSLFEFIGHKADFYFQIGPNNGIVEFTINEEMPASFVDCFAPTASTAKLISIDTNVVQQNKVRFTATGQRNAASSSSSIGIVMAEYHQVLLGEAQEEQFFSNIGNTFTIGS